MASPKETTAFDVFAKCVEAIQAGTLIRRQSKNDKEFHFQDWFRSRLAEAKYSFDQQGRNSYPDFTIVKRPEGYEIKGLAYPGRWINYDSNSQVPTGFHNERTIFYVFGRYPAKPDGNTYPVLDLVICHGDFLNSDHEYVHENQNVKGFGSYGDIMIRDRKMYVAPTPFGLLSGVAHHRTLIVPEQWVAPKDIKQVGSLSRTEAESVIVGYDFDLTANLLTPRSIPNPNAGRRHLFRAWRLNDDTDDEVEMPQGGPDLAEDAEETEDE